MKRLLYTGSFDPITYGHLEIIERASKLCDELLVGVGVNANKTPMFSVEERMELIMESTKYMQNVMVCHVSGLTVEEAIKREATLVRGIRNMEDLCREQQIAGINTALERKVDTIYLLSSSTQYISSSAVKELFKLGCDGTTLWKFVPACVVDAMLKLRKGTSEPR